MKVGIYTASWPTKEFVNRLLSGLTKTELELIVFGTSTKKAPDFEGLKVVTYRLFSPFNYSKILHLVKFTLLLTLFKPAKKRILDRVIASQSSKKYQDKAAFYPILWHSPDILHIQWANSAPQLFWVKQFGIKLVVSLRGAHINYSPLTVPGLADAYHKCFPEVDGFHGVSRAICLQAANYGADLEKCKVIYSGFDLNQFPKREHWQKFDRHGSRPINLLSVGRNHWKKGYHYALNALMVAKAKGVAFTYTIVGVESNEELFFQRDQLGLNNEVNFMPTVSFEAAKKMIASADVLLLPSVEEGIANVVLEAMLLGTIAVATTCGGMDEVIENEVSGFLVPVRDVSALADTICKIAAMQTQALVEIAESAYLKVSSQHNEKQMVEGMLALYKEVQRQ